MDVIGNNIANVNTIGFKASRTIFQDVFSQTVQMGSGNMAAEWGSGGTNAIQIGLGVRLSTIDVLHGPAPMQRTDRALDMMINDDGYFIVGMPSALHEDPFGIDPDADPADIARFDYLYTRAGDFRLDNEGYLVTSTGHYVMGFAVSPYVIDDPGPPPTYEEINIEDYNPDVHGPIFWMTNREDDPFPMAIKVDDEQVGLMVDADGMVSVIQNERRVTIFQLAIANFANVEGLERVGNSKYREGTSSGTAQIGVAGENGTGTVSSGGLEMSNVDLATEFTDMIVTQRGFQANSRIITVSDTMLEELVNLKR